MREIIILMDDGVVKTLCEVRHIPDLKKNLVSLGILRPKDLAIQLMGTVIFFEYAKVF